MAPRTNENNNDLLVVQGAPGSKFVHHNVVMRAKEEGRKIAFRCNCGCHLRISERAPLGEKADALVY